MIVGLGVFGLERAARPLEPLAPLDPADLVAKGPGDADIVILALRHMQDVLEHEASDAEPSAREAEEYRIGLLVARLVDRHRVVERRAERLLHMVERPALRIGH